jgi:MtfA peptidase
VVLSWFRRRAVDSPLPANATDVLAANLQWWPTLDTAEQQRLLEITQQLLTGKRWEAAQGFELVDDVRLLIAAQAALLVLHLDDDAYDDVDTIIVHASTVRLRGERGTDTGRVVVGGPFAVSGQAHPRGPVLISWNAARREMRFPGRGQNVVFHEFAHKLDMADSFVDGTPPLPDEESRARWIEVCTAEYEAVRRGEPGPLRPYAGTNPAEFFAVATEVFFGRPLALLVERPALHAVLRDFYRQDPALRLTRDPSPPATQGVGSGDPRA